MRFRIYFLLVTLFFVTMNLWLWRSEFAGQGLVSGALPPGVVWRKILTAPDNSRLAIEHRGKSIGHCTWLPNVGEEVATGKVTPNDLPPEGMIRRLAGYTLDLDGSVLLAAEVRLRFACHLKFDPNQDVQELIVSLKIKSDTWELRYQPADSRLALNRTLDEESRAGSYDLTQPGSLERVLEDLGWPLPSGLWPGMGLAASARAATPEALGLKIETRNDWLQLGHARLRGYRVQVRLLDRYTASLFVNLLGEIQQVDLPAGVSLINDDLTDLR